MNTLQLTETVGTIAAKDYRNTKVFRQLGINFSYAGNKTIEEASKEAGVTIEQVKVALEQNSLSKPTTVQEFNKWDIDVLIDYIINSHHRYAKENAVIIYDLAKNVANHYSEKHPELPELVTALFLFLNDLLNHLKKEEQILFPNIRQLMEKKSCAEGITYTTFGFIKESVIEMKKEHLVAGNELKLFRKLTNDYLAPDDACNSYKYLFEKMREFENDLFLHVHLENNILFPKAITLDEELKEQERNIEAW
jgi:regulator of cell morphogenesis and NO signaling